MARPINATLFVTSFTPTIVPGEYTFENALFNNQTDATGNGALDVVTGGVLFVPALDTNTGFPVPGVVHRYKLTSVTVIDPGTLSGTILWDETSSGEVDQPANGMFCLYSEATPNKKYGIPPSDLVYPDLPPGSSVAALGLDIRNISDTDSVSLPSSIRLTGTTSGSAPVVLTPDSDFPVIQNHSSAIFHVSVLGRRTDLEGEGCAFTFVGMIVRGSNSSTTVILGQSQKTIVARSDTSWDATVLADTVNGGISIQVDGSSLSTLDWVASIDLVKSTT